MQGQISDLISNTTIDKSGETIQLKDAYSSLEQLVNSISLVIGDHTSYLNPDTGEAETVISSLTSIRADLNGIKLSVSNNTETLTSTSAKVSELESTLDGFKTLVNQYESNVTELQTNISNYKTEINQSINSINQTVIGSVEKVTELETNINNTFVSMTEDLTGITSKITTLESNIDNFAIGTRNYILASDFSEDIYTKYWDIGEYYSIEEYEHNYYYFHHVLVCENNSRIESDTSQCIDSINANTKYTLSCKAKGEATITFGEVIYNKETEKNDYIIHRIDVDSQDYKKYIVTFNTNENIRYGYVTITTPGKSNSKVTLLKLEEGNTASDWTPAPEETEGKISEIDTSVKETTTQISLLKDSIDLKVSSTEFNNAITTMNTEIQLQAGKIESKVEINDVGTIISQSPNDVMTAFNGISQYFNVSPQGAKFGNIVSGDYTAMNDKGLVHHIGNSDYEYMYLTYFQQAIITIPKDSSSGVDVTVNYSPELIAMLNGRKPKKILAINVQGGLNYIQPSHYEVGNYPVAWVKEIGTTECVIHGYYRTLGLEWMETVLNGTVYLSVKSFYGGEISADLVFLA